MTTLAIESKAELPPSNKAIGKPPKQKKIVYTYDHLRKAIDKQDSGTVKLIIQSCPHLFTKPKPSQNALKYASLCGKTKIVNLLLETSFKQYAKQITKGTNFINDAMVQCIRFQRFDMVKLYVEAGFDLNSMVFDKKKLIMSCIDFAIVGGHYQIAYYIYPKLNTQLKNLKNTKQYEIIGKKYQYRYVNYSMFIQGLLNNVSPDNIGNYLKKELSPKQKQKIRRIHHEGCWEWLMRILGLNKKSTEKEVKKAMIDSADTKYPNTSEGRTENFDKEIQPTQRPFIINVLPVLTESTQQK